MTIVVELPGAAALVLDHLLLDINGTLTRDGRLLDGAAEAFAGLHGPVSVRPLSADSFGTAQATADELGAQLEHISHGHAKRICAERLGAGRCAAIGNGRNDVGMLSAVALGIAVIGPEGAALQAVAAADVICTSVLDALALLHEPARMTATLRP
jgi:soluble P-type ATPase